MSPRLAKRLAARTAARVVVRNLAKSPNCPSRLAGSEESANETHYKAARLAGSNCPRLTPSCHADQASFGGRSRGVGAYFANTALPEPSLMSAQLASTMVTTGAGSGT